MDPVIENKLAEAHMVIEDAFDRYASEKLLVAWSAGKDSNLLLRLILDVCQERGVRPPLALGIEERDEFDELTAFRDRLVAEWQLDLIIVRNSNFLDQVQNFGDKVPLSQLDAANQTLLRTLEHKDEYLVWQPESPVCNQLLKTLPINQAIVTRGIQAMFTGIRWDEHESRAGETYFSQRQHPPHTRIHPLLHFTERDIWNATFALGLPFSDLYREGYRSIGTRSGTHKPADIPAWEQDLEQTNERGGRSAEKERMMAQLRAWGYM